MKYPFTEDEYSQAKHIFLGLSNYYGEVEAFEINGKYYLGLENWSGISHREISEEFFNAIKKEFETA